MYARKTTIMNTSGLHARPASEFIACASKFKSKIMISKADDKDEANAKSIIMLLTLALNKGTEVEIKAIGEDEAEAVDKLVALVESKFGEN